MNLSRHYKALELDKVLLMLAEETGFSDARERALEITPSTDFERVQMLIRLYIGRPQPDGALWLSHHFSQHSECGGAPSTRSGGRVP